MTPRAIPARIVVGVVAAAACALAAVLLWPGADASSTSSHRSASLPSPPRPLLDIGAPAPLRNPPGVSTWAAVARPAAARSAPRAMAPVVARVATRAPEGTANLVSVLGRRRDDGGRVWVEVRVPALPNGTTGWLPRDAIGGYRRAHTRLIVSRAARRATLYRDGRAVFRAPAGVGRPRWPTPTGRFVIRSRLTRYGGGFYGPIAFGTTARSAVLTDWPDGGFVGIHGTDRPGLIPGAVSHGCIRLRNRDIVRLATLMPVGTALVIR